MLGAKFSFLLLVGWLAMILGPLAFMLGKRPGLFSRFSGGALSPLCLVLPACKSPWLWAYLK